MLHGLLVLPSMRAMDLQRYKILIEKRHSDREFVYPEQSEISLLLTACLGRADRLTALSGLRLLGALRLPEGEVTATAAGSVATLL